MNPRKRDIVQQVRESFRPYYRIANEEDAAWLDALAVAWSILVHGVAIPRALVPKECRLELERSCDSAERQFMFVRDRVRCCSSFRKLPPSEQHLIEAVLFDVRVRLSD